MHWAEELHKDFDVFTKDDSYHKQMPLEKPKTLYECLDMFSQEESLDAKCPKCGEQVESRLFTGLLL